MRAGSANTRFLELIENFAGKHVLAIGDLMLDEFIWGRVSRISPEAPVPVVNVVGESYYPGGAANVARNLREFTAAAAVMGRIGNDDAGCRLLQLLGAAGIDTAGVQQDAAAVTTLKTRIVARHQQVVRVDRERPAPLDGEQAEQARAHVERVIAAVDAVVVADYGKGFLTQAFADTLCGLARKHGKVLTIDPHPRTSLVWRGATAIKPNRAEAFNAAGVQPAEPVDPVLRDEALLEAGKRLLQKWETNNLLITLGEQGMLLFQGNETPRHIPARAQEVFDVSGAGDTAIAVFTLALSAGATPEEAAELANRASGIVVGKLGTATVTPAELRASFESDSLH
ncbi:MAG TPA: D-glycero-beta-D-manno-heptose-7-phosphate kinase [Bryobacteraceae bacterium]|nr:D-glycero-beta-D-manno-heptose-7-phosphate kinase [Bryobacteraceae bacterium]